MSNASAGVHARNMQAAFADKNAAEFPFKRANDGGFFLIIPPAQPAFFIFEVNSFTLYKDD